MPNKLFRHKGIREKKSEPISDVNAAKGTKYLFFAMRDVSDFKSTAGYDGQGRLVYYKEFFSIMFGNHELTEYVLVEPKVFDDAVMAGAKKVAVADCVMEYTYKKGMFSRRYYNARFRYDGVEYYVFVKTCNDRKFSELMTEFFTDKLV